MAGPIEIMIVIGAFAIVGTYLYIVSRFLRNAGAEEPRQLSQATTPAEMAVPRAVARAH